MDKVFPPVAFYFRLSFSGGATATDASFKEVSGISMEMDTEEIAEGGNNSFKHRVPATAKYSNLVLKRGMASSQSPLISWCIDTISGDVSNQIETKTILVTLLNENGLPLKAWKFVNASPVKWAASDSNSMNNGIVIETLEFAYSYFEAVDVP
jgi:phage tail-like protein